MKEQKSKKELRVSSVPRGFKSSFASDATALISSQAIISVLAVGISIIMARALGAEGRGQFALALLLPSILYIFSDFGMATAGPRFAATRRWPAAQILASHAVVGGARVIITGIIGLALIAFMRGTFFPGVPAEFLVLGLLQLIPLTVAGCILQLLLGFGLAKTYSRLQLLSSALAFAVLGAGWVIAGLDVRTALLLQLLAGFVASTVIWRKTNRAAGGLGRPSGSYLIEAYRFGMGVHLSVVTNFANTRLIWLFINSYAGAAGLGIYTIAQTASERVYLLADAMGAVLLPRVAEDPERNSARLTPIVFRIAMIVGAAVSVGLALVADWLIPLLFGDEFSGAVTILRLLLVSVVFSSGWRVLYQDLNGRGHTGQTAMVNGIAALVGLGLAIVFLPRFGIEGAAWSSIASAGVSLLAGVWLFGCKDSASKGFAALFIPTMRERAFVARFLRGSLYAAQRSLARALRSRS